MLFLHESQSIYLQLEYMQSIHFVTQYASTRFICLFIFSPPYLRSCCKYATYNSSLRFDACYTFPIACTPCTRGCFLPILHTLSKARLCTDYTFFVLFSLFHLQIIRFISSVFACFNLVSVFVGVAR